MSSWAVAKLLSPGGLLVVVMQPPRTCLATSSANGALLVLDILTTGQELGFALPWGSFSPPVPPSLVLPPAPTGAVPACWVRWMPGPRSLPRVELC